MLVFLARRLTLVSLAPVHHPSPSSSKSLSSVPHGTARHLLVLLQRPPPPSAALVIAIPHSNTPATSAFPVSLKKNRDAKPDRDSSEPLYRTIPSLAVLSTSYRPSYHTGLATILATFVHYYSYSLAAYLPLITPARPLIISLQIDSSLVLSLPINSIVPLDYNNATLTAIQL